MIKQRVKKVTYQIWEECSCGGRLEYNPPVDYSYHSGICRECCKVYERLKNASPRYEEEFEEVEE